MFLPRGKVSIENMLLYLEFPWTLAATQVGGFLCLTAYSLLAVGVVVGHVLETDTLWLTPTLPTDARKILILFFRNQQLAHLAVEFGSRMDDEWIMFKVGLDSWIKYNAITANTYYNIYCILYIYILTLLIIIVWLYYNQWHQISLLSPAQNGGVESHQVAQRNIDFAETCSDPGHTSFQ